MQLDKTKKYCVLGFGVEGKVVYNFLINHGIKKIEIRDMRKMEGLKAGIFGADYLVGIENNDVIFKSPGIKLVNSVLTRLADHHCELTSATKYFFDNCAGEILGITGSNGKTTTTGLIQSVLEKGNRKVYRGGNDRRPLLEELENIKKNDLVVLELSSFQLMDLEKSPHISVITNISENHLDFHSDMSEYIESKLNIVRFQTENDITIWNEEDEVLRKYMNLGISKKLLFSRNKNNANAYIENNEIIIRHNDEIKRIGSLDDIELKTNLGNLLVAALVGVIYEINDDEIINAIKEYRPDPYRLEFVHEFENIKFYNDSSSTTPESTINALEAFSDGNVVLIAGGSSKGTSFQKLAEVILKRRCKVVLIGETGEEIKAEILKIDPNYKYIFGVYMNFEMAINKSYDVAEAGNVVVLSPASASFDMFKNAKHRGKLFTEFVKQF